jgi:hypothetical protein
MATPDYKFRMETELLIDALYLHAARQACVRASKTEEGIRHAQTRWEALVKQERAVLSRYSGDRIAAYDELESVCIQMESADYEVGKAHAPLFEEAAAVHILCCAALEAHINAVARSSLGRREYDLFERLSLETKWQFLPMLCDWGRFDRGGSPYQGFAILVEYRNALVHYKTRKESWAQGSVPAFLQGLGLTVLDAESSIHATEGMVSELARMRNAEIPDWVRSDLNEMNYLEMHIEEKDGLESLIIPSSVRSGKSAASCRESRRRRKHAK